jgi:hypothetical protein
MRRTVSTQDSFIWPAEPQPGIGPEPDERLQRTADVHIQIDGRAQTWIDWPARDVHSRGATLRITPGRKCQLQFISAKGRLAHLHFF